MRTSAALFAVAAFALVAVASANTKGTTLRGFTFTSDVSDFLAISKDICDIRKILNSKNPDYKGAASIYMDGKNAPNRLSMRRLATGVNFDEPFWSLYTKHFKTPLFIDDVVQRALSGLQPYALPVQRVQLIVKSLESSLQVAVVMHKLDDAVQLLKNKKTDAALNALDAGWAIYVGGDVKCGLWTVSMKRANEFGTKVDCEKSKVADTILKAFLAAQAAVKKGDVKALEKARNSVKTALATNYIQAVITYAHEMYLDKAANLSSAEHQVEAYGFYRTIAPWIYASNKTAGEALDYWLFPGQPTTNDVDLKAARALGTAYKALGVTPDDVGSYGEKQPKLGCKAYVPTGDDKGGLLSSTNAKDSLRPTTGAPAPAPAPKPKRL